MDVIDEPAGGEGHDEHGEGADESGEPKGEVAVGADEDFPVDGRGECLQTQGGEEEAEGESAVVGDADGAVGVVLWGWRRWRGGGAVTEDGLWGGSAGTRGA